jgi:hypothetical protein
MYPIEIQFPQYQDVAEHIRRARLERSVYVAELIAAAYARVARGLKNLASRMSDGLAAERDRRAIEADVFLKRSVGRY